MTIQVISNTDQAVAAPAAVKPEGASALAAKAAEQKEPTESDTEEAEASEETEEAPETDADEADGDGDDAEKDKPKKKSGAQRRKEQAERAKAEAAEARREAEFWRKQALEGASEKKPEAKPEAASAVEPVGKPNLEDYETHAEYVEALTDWKIDQREKAREEKAQRSQLEAEQKKTVETHLERVESFKKQAHDYDDVLAEIDDLIFPPAVIDAISSSDLGPQVAYELAKNREEAERIAKLPPGAAYKAIGRLEAKIEARASDSKPIEPKKITQAPKPIEPVGSKGGRVEKSIDDPSLSQAEYERIRREQLKRRAASW